MTAIGENKHILYIGNKWKLNSIKNNQWKNDLKCIFSPVTPTYNFCNITAASDSVSHEVNTSLCNKRSSSMLSMQVWHCRTTRPEIKTSMKKKRILSKHSLFAAYNITLVQQVHCTAFCKFCRNNMFQLRFKLWLNHFSTTVNVFTVVFIDLVAHFMSLSRYLTPVLQPNKWHTVWPLIFFNDCAYFQKPQMLKCVVFHFVTVVWKNTKWVVLQIFQ